MAVNEDLTGFIREALNRGLPRDEIRDVLSQADWSDEEVRPEGGRDRLTRNHHIARVLLT